MTKEYSSLILDSRFTQDGYVSGFLMDENIVQELKLFYESLSNPYYKGFHPTLMWNDASVKIDISTLICHKLESAVKKLMPGYRLLYGNFMVKEPGLESIMKLHQDWSYVDESVGNSYAIWFPLQDLTDQNGVLTMVPRSHLIENNVRGPGVFCPFYDNHTYIENTFGKAIYLKKGEAVIWNHRVLHYSPPNVSSIPRLAVTAIIVPENVPIIHYFKEEENDEVEMYEVEDDFYFYYNIGKKPQLKANLLKKFHHRQTTYSKDILEKTMSSDVQHKVWWWKKVFLNKQ